MPIETKGRCGSCGTETTGDQDHCKRCGWDAKRVRRRCVSCAEAVEPGPDTEALKTTASAAGVVVLALGFFAGFLGTLAMLLGLIAVGRLLQSKSVAFRCTACNKVTPATLVRPLEREAIGSKSSELRLQALGLGAGSVIVLIIFGLSFSGRFKRLDADAIKALQAAGNTKKLAEIVSDVDDVDLQFDAAKALGALGPAGVRALETLLRHDKPRPPRAACTGLLQAGPAALPVLPTLMELAEKSPNNEVRNEIIRVIGNLGPEAEAALPLLEGLVKIKPLADVAKRALLDIRPKP